MHQWILPILIVVGLTVCRQPDIKKLNQSAVQQELTDSLILTLIYGNAEKSKEPCCIRGHDKFFSTVSYDSTRFSEQNRKRFDAVQIQYYVEHKEEIKERDTSKTLVVLGGSGFSCHACPGVCAGAVFVHDGVHWKLETYENDIAVLGQTGYPVNEVSVQETDMGYGLILKNGGVWQGVGWQYFTVVLYKYGAFKEALIEPVVFSSDNWSNAENDLLTQAYGYTSSIWFEPGEHESENMIVWYQGTVLDKKRRETVLLNRKVLFEYKDGFYTTKQKLPDQED